MFAVLCCFVYRFLSQFRFRALPAEEAVLLPVDPNPRWAVWTAAETERKTQKQSDIEASRRLHVPQISLRFVTLQTSMRFIFS